MSDQPFNLFDLSAKSGKKKPEKERPSSPKAAPLPEISGNDTEKILQKMKKMHSELRTQVELIFEKSGQDPRTFSDYFNNPSNFEPEEWSRLQRKKEEISAQILGQAGARELRKPKKPESRAAKERKGKTLGARKKWIDMR
jgi:hypothetical protein